MSKQQHLFESRQQSRQTRNGLIIFLLLFLLVVLIFAYTGLRLGNSRTQTSPEGQCRSNGQRFDGRQEAFMLAQMAEQYRERHAFNGDYAYASYTLCLKDGSQQRFLSPVAPGYDNTADKTKPRNDTHSEQALQRWLIKQLTGISFDANTLVGIYMIIFSQVRVCDACLSNMVSWQADLRQAAKTSLLYLAIWDIRPGTLSAFLPTVAPKGTGTPVAIGDLRRVSVSFTP
ncbi:MAG TPA: hypothetical protein VGF67_13115 [Ktedonobacteraceae bacterium]|jgi:hypothetical protein